jgi:hypothetical protein
MNLGDLFRQGEPVVTLSTDCIEISAVPVASQVPRETDVCARVLPYIALPLIKSPRTKHPEVLETFCGLQVTRVKADRSNARLF